MTCRMRYEVTERLDREQICRLTELFAEEWWTMGRTCEEVAAMLNECDVVIGLLEPRERELIAFARALTDGIFKAVIFDVIVARPYRGRGVGRELMRRALGHPRIRHVRHKELYCLPGLIPFYSGLEFVTDVGGVSMMRRGT
jgi:GNAT superfamily N-acetyltransferase